jgi:hypothetical protein
MFDFEKTNFDFQFLVGTFTIQGQSLITKVLDAALGCGYRSIGAILNRN